MSPKEDISINNFFIFNSSLCSKEDEEKNKILFFYPPSTSLDMQLKSVGFCEAVLKFTQTFSPEKPCETIGTKKTRQFFFQPEQDFWMIMTLNLPTKKPKEMAGDPEYLENEVQDSTYLAVLKLAYKMSKLFMGEFTALLKNNGNNAKQLKIKLEKFYFRYLPNLKLQNCDIIDVFQGIQYLPLGPKRFLHIQSLSNLLEAEFEQIAYSTIFYDQYLVWSGLDFADTQLIYHYITTTYVNNQTDLDVESVPRLSFSGRITSACRFLTGPKNFLENSVNLESIPKVYIHSTDPSVCYYLNVYKAINFIICIFIEENEELSIDLFKKLDKFLGDKLPSLSSMIKMNPLSSMLQAPTEKFLYFNKFNLAVKIINLEKKNSTAIPNEVMHVVSDICAENRRHLPSAEIVVKLMKLTDYWIVGKISDARECYFIMQSKDASLSYICEEANKICNRNLKNIFVHK